jgi:hypothetical protein
LNFLDRAFKYGEGLNSERFRNLLVAIEHKGGFSDQAAALIADYEALYLPE